MKKNTKKTTTRKPTRKPRATKVTTAPVQTAQPSAFFRGMVHGEETVKRTAGFVVGTTNGLVVRPVRNAFRLVVGSVTTTMRRTSKACGELLEGSQRKKPARAQRRKS